MMLIIHSRVVIHVRIDLVDLKDVVCEIQTRVCQEVQTIVVVVIVC